MLLYKIKVNPFISFYMWFKIFERKLKSKIVNVIIVNARVILIVNVIIYKLINIINMLEFF